MANICSFSMRVQGDSENVYRFYRALIQDSNVWIGRGAGDCSYEWKEGFADISGETKWSVLSSMIENAIQMRENPDKWKFTEEEKQRLKFLTLLEASKEYQVKIEVFSEESGLGFQEHFLIEDGKFLTEEVYDYAEYWNDGYDTKEEAEEDLEMKITDKEWKSMQEEEYFSRGGCPWVFSFGN